MKVTCKVCDTNITGEVIEALQHDRESSGTLVSCSGCDYQIYPKPDEVMIANPKE